MTKLLISATLPTGQSTEAVLGTVRADIIERIGAYAAAPTPEQKRVLANNVRILALLGDAIALAEENSKMLLDQ
jgi:hypothetical protein